MSSISRDVAKIFGHRNGSPMATNVVVVVVVIRFSKY